MGADFGVLVTQRLRGALGRRWPELLLVGLGILLRVRMAQRYHPLWGFDANDHLPYIEWFHTRMDLPPLELCRETYHPPLYYVIAGCFGRWSGGELQTSSVPSVFFACMTLLLVWFGLERHLPRQRLARVMALAVAAVLPSALHMAGMISAEALNGLLSVAAILLAAELLARPSKPPWWLAPVVGLTLGLQILAKISALMVVAAIAAAALLDMVWRRKERGFVRRALVSWAIVAAVFLVSSGWYFARNHQLYGKAVLTGYDGVDQLPREIAATPYLDRRTLGYFLGWTNHIFRFPHYAVASAPYPRFWPVLIASTFVDYYSYRFVPEDPASNIIVNGRRLSKSALQCARASMAGGTLMAVTVAAAWVVAAVTRLRRKDPVGTMMLLLPLGALVGQMHFATKFSWDHYGPVKGLYLLFASAPLFALWGIAVAWLARRRSTRLLALLQGLALACVASYSLYASFA